MKDILWTIYLAYMLMMSIDIISYILLQYSSEITQEHVKYHNIAGVLACIMWAIWYMYFLH